MQATTTSVVVHWIVRVARELRRKPVFNSMFLYVVVLKGFMATRLGLGTMRLREVGM
jgi:hypothetical protein